MRGEARVLAAVFAAGLTAASSAHAAFPGENGKIAFMDSNGVQVTDPAGRVITTLRDEGRDPAFSPDGDRIVFSDQRAVDCRPYPFCDFEQSLFTMNDDGTGVQQITRGGQDYYPSFSPDGDQIVFGRFGDARESEIFVANADGTGVRKLTAGNSDTFYTSPVFSPDGETIAFAQQTQSPRGLVSTIYAMDADGSDRRALTPSIVQRSYHHLSYSPDGERIAFDKTGHPATFVETGGETVFTMDADGSNVTRLTDGGAPAFSPDGEQLAFTRHHAEGCNPRTGSCFEHIDLYVADSDGENPVRLPRSRSDERMEPDWGTSGSQDPPREATCGGLEATIAGTRRNDVITGTGRPDVLAGLGGDDIARSLRGEDVACGGRNDDALRGGSGDDRLLGGTGSDTLYGGKGFDRCFGGKGETVRCERSSSA
jgi:Ca2+-binding RTX toxin-like protein